MEKEAANEKIKKEAEQELNNANAKFSEFTENAKKENRQYKKEIDEIMGGDKLDESDYEIVSENYIHIKTSLMRSETYSEKANLSDTLRFYGDLDKENSDEEFVGRDSDSTSEELAETEDGISEF